jgi:hypothetical protein
MIFNKYLFFDVMHIYKILFWRFSILVMYNLIKNQYLISIYKPQNTINFYLFFY